MNSSWAPFTAFLRQTRRFSFFDLLLIAGLVGLVLGVVDLAKVATAPTNPSLKIDLNSWWSLPRLTFFSLMRGLIAYGLSLIFTLAYGYWAAKDRVAERVLVPLLDILQSIPVLSFLPGVVLVLVACFPTSNLGVELAAILLIFTGQVWNMTFSYYHSIKGVPQDFRELAATFRLTSWERWRWMELPYATMGLVWNSMMSMAGGWFFLMVCETFSLGKQEYHLEGIGSYMKAAVDERNVPCQIAAIVAMTLMIIALDQFLWQPVVVWAQKYRVEEGGQQEKTSSWFLDWVRRSRLLEAVLDVLRAWRTRAFAWRLPWISRPSPGGTTAGPLSTQSSDVGDAGKTTTVVKPVSTLPARWPGMLSLGGFLVLMFLLVFGAWKLIELIRPVTATQWRTTWFAAGFTMGRVLASTALGTLWAVPAGLAIGLNPKLSRSLQPVIQVLASFPAPMLFSLVLLGLNFVGVPLNWGSILLMLLGTQWYILFNVVAGAMAIPADMREMARSYRLGLLRRFRNLYLPAVFPFLVTGWVTAAGGAWNASIVSEYIKMKATPAEAAAAAAADPANKPAKEGEIEADNEDEGNFVVYKARGLGALINEATEKAEYSLLAASTLVMALVVVTFNRTVWRACYQLAETRYSLNK